MSSAGEAQASVRARPLSGGLWSLLSWLRREGSSSSGSCSSLSSGSAGSDRTVASFAFLAPWPREHRASQRPDPSPQTDTYKRRVTDRNLRRHIDRNLTLHRKYGLFKDNSYDGFSLPCARRNFNGSVTVDRAERERRATSECYQLRAAYVPGKRRAPPPPARQTGSLPRRNTRKRRAPPPPTLMDRPKELGATAQQAKSSCPPRNENHYRSAENSLKTEILSATNGKESSTKLRNEKTFLKKIFDMKKRNSTIDPAPGKILPSISELDKQAAELIESCKSKRDNLFENGKDSGSWLCTKCLKKYDSSVAICLICNTNTQKHLNQELVNMNVNATNIYTQTNSTSSKIGIRSEEKQKLKEMLKEMKDSLPKRVKRDLGEINQRDKLPQKQNHNEKEKDISFETPTLRIESTAASRNNMKTAVPSTSKVCTNSILVSTLSKEQSEDKRGESNGKNIKSPQIGINTVENVSKVSNKDVMGNLHIPLKVSTLLNPVYIPKTENSGLRINKSVLITPEIRDVSKNLITHIDTLDTNTEASSLNIASTNVATAKHKSGINSEIKLKTDQNENQEHFNEALNISRLSTTEVNINTNERVNKVALSKAEPTKVTYNKAPLDQHSKRRDLINQLEKSIASGDERAAADAAVKLAQLRLSCSVLSFSSQIAGSSKTNVKLDGETKKEIDEKSKPHRVDVGVKPMSLIVQKNANDKGLDINYEFNNKEVNKPTEIYKQENKGPSAALPSTSKQVRLEPETNIVPIEIWVEDREATRGPIRLRIELQAVMGDLRRQAEISLGLPARLQRWIVGRTLSNDDSTPLISLAGPNLSAPFYLCVVEAGASSTISAAASKLEKADAITKDTKHHGTASEVYTELMQLEQQSLVPNAEPFECGVCMEKCTVGAGVVIRECVHSFCKDCLVDLIRHCEEPVVSCPAFGCTGVLQEREIRTITTQEEYERWLARGLAAAESGTRNAFHCRTRDCTGWALCDTGVRRFPCPVCKRINCVPCAAIHEGESCEQYRKKIEKTTECSPTETDEGTQALLENLITKGEALKCPECSAIITKKWGCDWVKCSACKTEICWVTRGRRWGPAGRGDTSAGCRCGVDGKRCHPTCGYCH